MSATSAQTYKQDKWTRTSVRVTMAHLLATGTEPTWSRELYNKPTTDAKQLQRSVYGHPKAVLLLDYVHA